MLLDRSVAVTSVLALAMNVVAAMLMTRWNRRKHPLHLDQPADQILANIDCERRTVSTTDHY